MIFRRITLIITGVLLSAGAVAVGTALHFIGRKFGIALSSDKHDIMVYFTSARWVTVGGRLYREVGSEYPLFANLLFSVFRYLSNEFKPGFYDFYVFWIVSSWCFYLIILSLIVRGISLLAALPWLAPGAIFFALFRYDIYPVFATLMFMFAVQRAEYIKSAIWLGIAIALKGYALFMLPAYCVFLFYQRGLAVAIKTAALAVAPMILSLLATYCFAGWEGMIAPFQLQAVRTLNGETTYDAINYLFATEVIANGSALRWVGQLLQIGCALAAAAMRPRTFADLTHACLFSVLGFVSFSLFYSPQYVLWILPLVCFSGSRIILISATLLSWLSYLSFPIGYYLLTTQPAFFRVVVIIGASLRLLMMALAVKECGASTVPYTELRSY